LYTINAWDVNCSSHIVARYTEEHLEEFFTAVRAPIVELEAENQKLRVALAQQTR